MKYEVIVVGAGPGGSSAAYYLTSNGRRVLLLDKQSFPRDKSCGDGLTRSGARLLAEMGILNQFENNQKVRGARVYVRGQGSRDFRYPTGLGQPDHGLVVPRTVLDHALCRHAVKAGADLWENTTANRLLWTEGLVSGVEVTRNGRREKLLAPVVIAADGASSRLAREAGLVTTPANEMGFAIRGYYTGLGSLLDLLEIYMPLMDATDQYLLPSYGWVFPTGPDSANIGVGLFQRVEGMNVRDLMTKFLDYLRQEDERFSRISLQGQWRGAPLRFDFQPDRCSIPGLLLVGDAAGLISPFTGEGISYAIESGKLAAETIHEAFEVNASASPDLSSYSQLLGHHFVGYFEAGRQSSRRYSLLWHVLESTFHNDKPIFTICRQAALFPEGLGESYAGTVLDDVSSLVEKDEASSLQSDLLATNEVLADTVRREWPFLVRAVTPELTTRGIPFRPALLLYLSAYLGQPQRPYLHQVGAAIEQGYLAAISHLSVEEEPETTSQSGGYRPANWGNMFALIVGDFLMSKAFELSAHVGVGVSADIANALAQASEGQVRELREAYNLKLTPGQHLEILGQKMATLFELPCRLGGRLGKAPPALVAALATYGRHMGLAYQLAEDCRTITGGDNGRLQHESWPIQADPRRGIYNLPILLAAQSNNEQGRVVSELLRRLPKEEDLLPELIHLVGKSGAIKKTVAIAREEGEQAQAALSQLPDVPARRSLYKLAMFAVTRS